MSDAFRISVATNGRETIDAFEHKVQAAERGGAAQIWLASHLFERDPAILACRALHVTTAIPVALMAVSPFTIHPVQACMAVATLDEMFPGRAVICFGGGTPLDLKAAGISVPKPLQPMREALAIAKTLLSGAPLPDKLETFRITGRILAQPPRAIPVMLAATGPKMLELAAVHADGVVLSGGASVEFVRDCVARIRKAACGRYVRITAIMYASAGNDSRAHLRRLLAVSLRGPQHRPNLELAGTVLDQEKLREYTAANNWRAADEMITDAVLRKHSAGATADEISQRVLEYRDAGVNEAVVSGQRSGDEVAAILDALRDAC